MRLSWLDASSDRCCSPMFWNDLLAENIREQRRTLRFYRSIPSPSARHYSRPTVNLRSAYFANNIPAKGCFLCFVSLSSFQGANDADASSSKGYSSKRYNHLMPLRHPLGDVLLSQDPAVQVPSALKGLTVVFEMGTRGSPSPSSPNRFFR